MTAAFQLGAFQGGGQSNASLNTYLQETRRLLHDPNGQAYSDTDLTFYINLGRRRIARATECIRVLLRGGTIISIAVTNGGSGYTSAPAVSFTGMGQLAIANAVVVANAVTAVNVVDGGWGYITAPTVVFSGGGGTGAAATASVDNSASTVPSQEIVRFSTLNVLAQLFAGVKTVVKVFDVAIQWGQGAVYKPTLRTMIWSEFQAYRRINANQFVNFPCDWSMYAQGENGSFYLFPLPSSQMSMDVDCACTPIDLASTTDPEAIPDPWTETVPYYAAFLAYNQSSRKADADRMYQYLKMFGIEDRAAVEAPFIGDYYGD